MPSSGSAGTCFERSTAPLSRVECDLEGLLLLGELVSLCRRVVVAHVVGKGDVPRLAGRAPARHRRNFSRRPGRLAALWYVDGAPFQVADYPYTVRWRLAAGEHVFQARLIDGRTASSAVHVLVQ